MSAVLATFATVLACAIYTLAGGYLLGLATNRVNPVVEIGSATVVEVSSCVTVIIAVLESWVLTGIEDEVAGMFFFIATSTGIFAILAFLANLPMHSSGAKPVLEKARAMTTGMLFGNAMLVVDNVIAFSQIHRP